MWSIIIEMLTGVLLTSIGIVGMYITIKETNSLGDALCCFISIAFGCALVVDAIRDNSNRYFEVKANEVQIDTVYTTVKDKTDTTYVIKYKE